MEFSLRAIILGILLALVLGAANAYLGLKVGMTVSASIPAAVISFAILRWFRQSNILENNLVQTAASAGESLAAGMIFTLPALILLGAWQEFDYLQGTLLITLGGLLGVLIAVPLRKALIGDRQHAPAELTFPEGLATAEVLKAGYSSGNAIKALISASLIAAIVKFLQSGIGVASSSIAAAYQSSRTLFGFGMDLSPALIAVGFIVRLRIASLMFIGGAIIWFIAMPLYSWSYPQVITNSAMDAGFALWSSKLRFIGVGAMLVSGVWVLALALKPVWRTVQHAMHSTAQAEQTEFSVKHSFLWMVVMIIPIALLLNSMIEQTGIVIFGVIYSLLAGFLFSMVAAYMAGLVGSSNNPISGVTIATIFLAALIVYFMLDPALTDSQDAYSKTASAGLTIMIGAIVCCAAAISGDTMQDLKAGQIVGAKPRYQTWMQLLGVIAAGVILIPVLTLLYEAYGFAGYLPREGMDASQALAAPQASLMKSVVLGVFGDSLEWNLIIIGILIAAGIIVIDLILQKSNARIRIPVMAVAVGMYLPVTLSAPIFIGGLIAHALRKKSAPAQQNATLFASGLIAGEAMLGIFLAIPFVIMQDTSWLYLFDSQSMSWNYLLAIVLIAYVCYMLFTSARENDHV